METVNNETLMIFFKEALKKTLENTVFEVNNTVKSREKFAKMIKKALKLSNFKVDIEDITYGIYTGEVTKALFKITLENGKISMLKYDDNEKQFKYID